MREAEEREIFQNAVDRRLSGLQENPFLAQRIMNAEKGEIKVKKKLTMSMVLVIVLILIAVTALAVALLSPKEIVEQVAVPVAQSNDQENYTYEELADLIRTLNENGITLDEGSTLMQAFQSGHGYWEKNTIDEICYASFGKDQGAWTLEQKHWYGEMMVAIGVSNQNIWLLPEEGEITKEQARNLAADTLQKAYGIELPTESNETWIVSELLQMGWNEEKQLLERDLAEWEIWYINRSTGNMDYSVSFNRFGNNPTPQRARYTESINTREIYTVMDDLENRDGSCTHWSLETWAEFGERIRDLSPSTRKGWLYQHADYCLPPDNAISVEHAKQIAKEATGMTGLTEENVICCVADGRSIYKICQRGYLNQTDLKSGQYDSIWCIELDCVTGEVLGKNEYSYHSDDVMMMYVPFSLLNKAPSFEEEARTVNNQADHNNPNEKEIESVYSNYTNMYFLSLEKQKELFGYPHAVPAQEEYEQALTIAQKAVENHYGPEALISLGDYQVGVIYCIQENVDGVKQKQWDFLFTTDPEYLSDGYRVQFRQNTDENLNDGITELSVEHANVGNG